MVARFFVLILLSLHSLSLCAQEESSFTMTISSDTVLMGNTLQLTYSISNLEGEFIAPDLSDFRVVSGPNVSSQFSSINGKVSQKSSYSYYLLPLSPGIGTIGEAEVKTMDDTAALDGAKITILENPNGIQAQYGSMFYRKNKIKGDTL